MTRFLVLASCITATACVAKTRGQDQSLNQSEASVAGGSLATEVENSGQTFGPVNSGSSLDRSCVELSGDIADADGDSVPVAATLTFDCTTKALGFTATLTGTESVVDDQPNLAAWSFTAQAHLEAVLTGPTGDTLTIDRDGSIVATQDGLLGPYHLQRNLAVSTVAAGSKPATIEADNAWMMTFKPQLEQPWSGGDPVVGGKLDASGTWNFTVSDASNEISVEATIDGSVTLSPSCATRVTSGTVTGTFAADGATKSIEVTWSSCGQHTVAFSDQ